MLHNNLNSHFYTQKSDDGGLFIELHSCYPSLALLASSTLPLAHTNFAHFLAHTHSRKISRWILPFKTITLLCTNLPTTRKHRWSRIPELYSPSLIIRCMHTLIIRPPDRLPPNHSQQPKYPGLSVSGCKNRVGKHCALEMSKLN